MTTTNTDEITTAEPFVIFPAVTCRAEFPTECASVLKALRDIHLELVPLLRTVRQLSEEFETVLERNPDLDWSGDALPALEERTGYGWLHEHLRRLMNDAAYAIGDSDEYVPSWLVFASEGVGQ